MSGMQHLEQSLRYQFKERDLLRQALTHRSYAGKHNERLEFLGDGVLNFVVAALLFKQFQRIDEGDLSRVRASLVKQDTLAQLAQQLQVASYLRLGEGELKSGGFNRPSIQADAVEAIFGAIYLDGGFAAVYKVIEQLYRPLIEQSDPKTLGKDAKTLLQDTVQALRMDLPIYTVLDTQVAAHDQTFVVSCTLEQLGINTRAKGSSRRSAEQAAASLALAAIDKQHKAN